MVYLYNGILSNNRRDVSTPGCTVDEPGNSDADEKVGHTSKATCCVIAFARNVRERQMYRDRAGRCMVARGWGQARFGGRDLKRDGNVLKLVGDGRTVT